MTSLKDRLMTSVVGLVGAAAVLAMSGPAGAANAAQVAHGKAIFETTCVACHGADGKGSLPGAPDFTKPHGVLSLPDAVLYSRIIDGYQAPGAPMAMPAKGGDDSLSATDVHAVVAYMRAEFLGQSASK